MLFRSKPSPIVSLLVDAVSLAGDVGLEVSIISMFSACSSPGICRLAVCGGGMPILLKSS